MQAMAIAIGIKYTHGFVLIGMSRVINKNKTEKDAHWTRVAPIKEASSVNLSADWEIVLIPTNMARRARTLT